LSWLAKIVKAYEDSEAPPKFFYWAGLSAISAVAKKHVFLNRGGKYKLYPNIYVIIVAGSGMKKGIPANFARKIVSIAGNTRIIPGRNSIQAILKELGQAKTLPSGGMVKDAQGFITSGELDASLVSDAQALTILTDLYNTHEYDDGLPYINNLKSAGTDTLNNPCLTIFGATNEELFADYICEKDMKGGFLARTFIVMTNERGNANDLLDDAPDIDVKGLSTYLVKMRDKLIDLESKKTNFFRLTPEARDLYRPWYLDLDSKLRSNALNDPTGTFSRLGDQVLKLAMLISLSKRFDLVIDKADIFDAIAQAEMCSQSAKHISMGNGKGDNALATKKVVKFLLISPNFCTTRGKILQNFWGDKNQYQLDMVIETLNSGGVINVKPCGKDQFISLKKEAAEFYAYFKKGIQ
jgi:hypothetical protein